MISTIQHSVKDRIMETTKFCCWRLREMCRWSTEDFYGSGYILYNTIMMDIHHYIFAQIHIMYIKTTNLVMMTCQWVHPSSLIILVSDVYSVEGYACIRVLVQWGSSVPSAQFYCKAKTTLKNKIFFKWIVWTN